MERSVLVEENHQRSDSTPISKSLGSIVRIDGISIELAAAMENNHEARMCEHFSIRGYAAEMRKKDVSVSLPFSFDGNQNKLEEQTNMLPPLHVPKFRWWRCQNCLRETGTTNAAEEIGIVYDHFQNGVTSASTCPHIFPSDVAMVLSADLDNFPGRKPDGNNSGSKDEIRLSSHGYSKEKKHEVGHAAVLGRGNGARDDENQVHDLTTAHPCSIQKRHADDPNTLVSKIHGFGEFCAPNYEIHNSADLKTPERMVRNSAEILQMGTLASSDCHHDQHMDSPGSSIRQRTQKVRLLTELLGSEQNSESDQIRTDGGSPGRIPTVSSGLDAVSALRDNMAVQGSLRKHLEDSKGKRKMSLDKEGKSPSDLICPSKVMKKVRVLKEGSENRKIDGNPTQSDKKNKQIQLQGGHSPSMPQRGVMRKINQVKIGDVGKHSAASDGGLTKSAHNAFMTNGGMKPYFRSSLSPRQSEPKTITCKKKNKQIGAGKASLVPKRPSVLGESSIMRKCLDIKETEPSTHVSFAGKGLDLSLNSYVVAHQSEKCGIDTNGDGIDLLLPPRKGTPREDAQQRKAIMHIGESSVSHKSASDRFYRKGLLCDLNENIVANRTSPLREMQNLVPRIENGSFSRHQNLDYSGTRSTEEVQEQGNDDIPMEIVELMARNQYERFCHETERNLFFSKQTNNKRNTELMGFSRVHGNGMLKSLQEDKFRMVNPVSGMGIVTAGENGGLIKRNPSSCLSEIHGNHFGQLEANSAFAGFSAFSKYKEKQTGGVQISDSGSIRSSNPQNCKWKGSPNGSRQSEEARPNHMVFGFNIPQMHGAQSSNFEFHSQFSKPPREGRRMIGDHDLNFMKPNANDLGKGKRSSDSEFRRETAEYPFVSKHRGFDLNEKVPGSLDLNCNETIPAMQLLSLMDAGVQSTSAFSLDGNPKFFTKPFFPCSNHPKVLEKPLFAYDHHSKRGAEAYNDISRNPPSTFYVKNISEKSCECPPAVPAVGAFVSPFQNQGNFKRVAGFTKSEEQGKSLVQSRGRKSQKPTSTSGVLRTNRQSNPVQIKEKGIIYASDSNFMDLEANYMNGTVFPTRSISKDGICTLNRNPADFSIPEAGNVYMISGKDLKFGKAGYSKGGSGLNHGDGRKRQRVTKLK